MGDFYFIPKKVNKKILFLVIAGVLLAILISQSVYSVDAKEKGVILRFGRYSRTADPGLNFKIPFVDTRYRVTIVDQTLQFGRRTKNTGVNTTYDEINDYSDESRMLTGDLGIIDLPFTITYRINDPYRWLIAVENSRIRVRHGQIGTAHYEILDMRIKILRDVSSAIINRMVGDLPADEVRERGKEIIAAPAINEINETVGPNGFDMGVIITTVNLGEVIYPSDVQLAIEDVVAADQDKERLINEGREAYNREVPKAEGDAEKMAKEAEGAVARFNSLYAEYQENPAIFRERYYYETMEQVLADRSKVEIIDGALENVLPIKNLSGTGGN